MEKFQCPCCGCLTLDERFGYEICPVCFWEDDCKKDRSLDINSPSAANHDLTIARARENLRKFGACSEDMAKNTRLPEESEITDEYRRIMAEKTALRSWQESLAADMGIGAFFLVVLSSRNSRQAAVYTVKDGAAVPNTDRFYGSDAVHDRYSKQFDEFRKKPGLHLWRFEYGRMAEERSFPESEYNSVLYGEYAVYAMLWKEYGLVPYGDDGRAKMDSVMTAAAKMRDSLVYACYIGDTENIIRRAKTARPAQLNKVIPYMSTPLGFCAKNDDIEGFKAVAQAGADIGKSVASTSPLGWAMIYSPDIAEYIFEHHRRQFDSELEKQGTRLFAQAADERVFSLADRCGLDLSPLAFDFAKTNNTAGMLHLINGGTDVLNMKDAYGHTPLYYAGRNGERTEAVREMIRALEERENNEKTSLSP